MVVSSSSISICFADIHKGQKNLKSQKRTILISGLIFYKKSLGERYTQSLIPPNFWKLFPTLYEKWRQLFF